MRRVALSFLLTPWLMGLMAFPHVGIPQAARAQPAPATPTGDPFHEYPDALTVPAEGRAAIAAVNDARFYYPSAYMAGSVAVQIILPESNGESGVNTETWTPAQVEAVRGAVDAALAWWQVRVPAARLSFTSELKIVPSAYEPISYGIADEGLWIGDVLRRLGHTQQSYFAQAFAAAHSLREAGGTDWALTIFVVNSAADPDGRFADRRFAYAYIGGPFMVVTSDAGAYGSANLAPVIAHEIGHLFGALDQYAAAQMGCELRGGYLAVLNANSRYKNCGGTLPSIMFDPLSAYAAGAVDPFALGQIGYHDSDADGLIDVLDTSPTLSLEQLAATGTQPLLTGRVIDEPFPSTTGLAISINRTEYFEYNLGDGLWRPTPLDQPVADDGRFALRLPLFDGRYTLGLRAINSAGVASPPITGSLEVQGLGAQPGFSASAAPFVSTPQLPLTLGGPATAYQLSLSPAFKGATWQPISSYLTFTLPSAHDGAQTVFVRFRTASGAVSELFALRTMLDRTPPTGQIQQLASGALVLTADDSGSGVAEMLLDVEPQLASATWEPYQAQLALPDGARLYGVRFRDRAGNVSPRYAPAASQSLALPLIIR
jgi:hypothetical protein